MNVPNHLYIKLLITAVTLGCLVYEKVIGYKIAVVSFGIIFLGHLCICAMASSCNKKFLRRKFKSISEMNSNPEKLHLSLRADRCPKEFRNQYEDIVRRLLLRFDSRKPLWVLSDGKLSDRIPKSYAGFAVELHYRVEFKWVNPIEVILTDPDGKEEDRLIFEGGEFFLKSYRIEKPEVVWVR